MFPNRHGQRLELSMIEIAWCWLYIYQLSSGYSPLCFSDFEQLLQSFLGHVASLLTVKYIMSFLPMLRNPQRRPPYAQQHSDVELLSIAPLEDTAYSDPVPSPMTVNRIKSIDHGVHLSPTGWPVNPQPLSKTALYRLISGLLDGFLAFLPLLFIGGHPFFQVEELVLTESVAMGVMTANLDGKALSDLGDMVQRATLLGPTVFPIMFAALVGSTLKTFARFRAEHGARLGVC